MDEQQQETATTKSVRQRDLAFEALVRETQANPHFDRGAINKALKAIRDASFHEGILPEDLHVEIAVRCDRYRALWPGISLTPGALAKHWLRFAAQAQSRAATAYEIGMDEARRMEER